MTAVPVPRQSDNTPSRYLLDWRRRSRRGRQCCSLVVKELQDLGLNSGGYLRTGERWRWVRVREGGGEGKGREMGGGSGVPADGRR